VKINRRNAVLIGALGAGTYAGMSRAMAFAKLFPGANETTKFENDASDVTNASERAVEKASTWLIKTINQDGGCGVDVSQPSDIGCSCMTGLAFMAQGNTAVEGERRSELRRIRKFLLQQVENMPSNDITSAQGTQLQNKIGRHAHSFFAALFLSQLFGEGTNPDPVKDALKKVVAAIVSAQSASGDWGTTSWAPTLGTVMGWVSLRASDFAGVSVGGAPQKTAEHLIKKMQHELNNRQGWMHELYKNASGIRVLYAMKMENEPIAKRAFEDALRLVSKDNTPFTQAGGEEFLAFHLITETMLQKGGEDWAKWFPIVRDKLIDVQNKDGSWTGHHCITSRTFCTAAAILVLTSPYRYLPISQD
jgi:hypothetical protein